MSLSPDPAPMPNPAGDPRAWRAPSIAGAITAAITFICAQMAWLGGDLPGALLRAETFRQGNYVRVPNWFGGFPNLTYSFLLSPIGATLGVENMMAICAGIATAGITVITRNTSPLRHYGAAACFGLAMVSTAAVGRATYLLGTAFAVWAMVALIYLVGESGGQHRLRTQLAVVGGALLTGLSSPVAGLFLAMAAFGLLVQHRRWLLAGAIGAAGVGPSTLANKYFHTSGALPTTWATALTVAAIFLLFVVGSQTFAVRTSAALGIAACLVVGTFDTPLAYIIKRLPETVGGATASANLKKWFAIPLIAGLAGWNSIAIVVNARDRGRGERSGAAFVALNTELRTLAPTGLVEVVPTKRHWETWHVARSFAVARGWERQADIDHGPFFYDDNPFDVDTYRGWLEAEHVQFVALSDLDIDRAGLNEAALLGSGQLGDLLTMEWSANGWTVWRVNSYVAETSAG